MCRQSLKIWTKLRSGKASEDERRVKTQRETLSVMLFWFFDLEASLYPLQVVTVIYCVILFWMMERKDGFGYIIVVTVSSMQFIAEPCLPLWKFLCSMFVNICMLWACLFSKIKPLLTDWQPTGVNGFRWEVCCYKDTVAGHVDLTVATLTHLFSRRDGGFCCFAGKRQTCKSDFYKPQTLLSHTWFSSAVEKLCVFSWTAFALLLCMHIKPF